MISAKSRHILNLVLIILLLMGNYNFKWYSKVILTLSISHSYKYNNSLDYQYFTKQAKFSQKIIKFYINDKDFILSITDWNNQFS